jgi:hypothetical protein
MSSQANKSKTQDLQALRDEHASALGEQKKKLEAQSAEQKKQLDSASEKITELESELGEAQKLADDMSAKSKRVSLLSSASPVFTSD